MPRRLPCLEPADRAEAIAAAVRAARNGRLVAVPAESGYVLVTDAFNANGVAALQRAKGLSVSTTLGVLLGHAGGVHGIAARIPPPAQDLMAAFWPGQLSLLLPVPGTLRWSVPTDRCAIRMPLHPVLLEVAAGVGPMVYSGCSAVERETADLFIDAGERPDGPGSTVIDATRWPMVLLREGAVSADAARAVVPDLLVA